MLFCDAVKLFPFETQNELWFLTITLIKFPFSFVLSNTIIINADLSNLIKHLLCMCRDYAILFSSFHTLLIGV